MIYTDSDAQFKSDLAMVMGIDGQAAVYAGVGTYKHEQPNQTIGQMTMARQMGADGSCLFAYASLFESVNPGQDDSPQARQLRVRMAEAVRAYVLARQ